MNKTLSLIEEEAEDEFFTNNEELGSNHALGDTRKMHPSELSHEIQLLNQSSGDDRQFKNEDVETPAIVKDIEGMERDFTKFLELIYN